MNDVSQFSQYREEIAHEVLRSAGARLGADGGHLTAAALQRWEARRHHRRRAGAAAGGMVVAGAAAAAVVAVTAHGSPQTPTARVRYLPAADSTATPSVSTSPSDLPSQFTTVTVRMLKGACDSGAVENLPVFPADGPHPTPIDNQPTIAVRGSLSCGPDGGWIVNRGGAVEQIKVTQQLDGTTELSEAPVVSP